MPQHPTVRRRLSAVLAAAWSSMIRRSAPADPMAAAFTDFAREIAPVAARRSAPAIDLASRRLAA